MKLYFKRDGRVDGELIYEKGKVYDVPEENGSADRWRKRGAVNAEEMKAKKAAGKSKDADKGKDKGAEKSKDSDKNKDFDKGKKDKDDVAKKGGKKED